MSRALQHGKRYQQMTSAVAIHAGACLVAFLTIGAGTFHSPARMDEALVSAEANISEPSHVPSKPNAKMTAPIRKLSHR